MKKVYKLLAYCSVGLFSLNVSAQGDVLGIVESNHVINTEHKPVSEKLFTPFTAKSAVCAVDNITYPDDRRTGYASGFFAEGEGAYQTFPYSGSGKLTTVDLEVNSESFVNGGAFDGPVIDLDLNLIVFDADFNVLYNQDFTWSEDANNPYATHVLTQDVVVNGTYTVYITNKTVGENLIFWTNSSDNGDGNGEELSGAFLTTGGAYDVPENGFYGLGDLDFLFSTFIENTIEADFLVNSQECIDSTFTFTNSSIIDTLGYHNLAATIYEWDFGDGSPISNEFEPEHVYTSHGMYDVLLTITYEAGDGELCTDSHTITIGVESANATHTNPTSCGATDGEISVTLENNTEEFSFVIDGTTYNSTNYEATVPALGADAYEFTIVLDGSGCEFPQTISLNDVGAPEIELASSGVSCAGRQDSWISVVPQVGDTSDYVFSWSTGVDADSIEVGAGSYNVTGTNGTCTISASILVEDGTLLDVVLSEANSVSCFESEDAGLNVTSPDGVDISGYTLVWSDDNGVIAGEEGVTLTNVGAGNYTVVGAATNDCNTTEETIVIAQPDAIAVTGSVTEGETEGAITTSATGGTGAYTISWTGPNNFMSSDATVTITENGTYTVTYEDANGCVSSESFNASTINVENVVASNIKVYPNPATASINFDVTDAGASNIYVFDVAGKSVATLDAVNNSLVKLNVEDLESGMYLYHITKQDGSMIVSSKFTVVK